MMCLAVPGKIIACANDEAVVDFQGNRLRVSTILTPQTAVGEWVLVHAGFALSTIEEKDALETWDYLRAMADEPPDASSENAGAAP
jgi:hydrogenase expression/formation protein HypC